MNLPSFYGYLHRPPDAGKDAIAAACRQKMQENALPQRLRAQETVRIANGILCHDDLREAYDAILAGNDPATAQIFAGLYRAIVAPPQNLSDADLKRVTGDQAIEGSALLTFLQTFWLRRSGQKKEGLKACQWLCQKEPENKAYAIALARQLAESGNPREAAELLEKLHARGDLDLHARQLRVDLGLGHELGDAESLLSEEIERCQKRQDNPSFFHFRRLLQPSEKGREALEPDIEALLLAGRDFGHPAATADALLLACEIFLDQGQTDFLQPLLLAAKTMLPPPDAPSGRRLWQSARLLEELGRMQKINLVQAPLQKVIRYDQWRRRDPLDPRPHQLLPRAAYAYLSLAKNPAADLAALASFPESYALQKPMIQALSRSPSRLALRDMLLRNIRLSQQSYVLPGDRIELSQEDRLMQVMHEAENDHVSMLDLDPPAAPANIKPGRNDPCPCGSGKKHKKCCGR